MDDLAAKMRAATDSPPPTRIDLDALIAGELRRRRTLRVAGAVAAVAVTALAIAVPALALSGRAPESTYLPGVAPAPNATGSPAGSVPLCAPLSPSPSGPQPPLQSYDTVRPRPTEPVSQAVPRLTEAVRAALREVLPAGMTVEAAEHQPDCAEPQFQYHPSYRSYDLFARVTDEQGSGSLVIRVLPSGGSGEKPVSCQPSSLGPIADQGDCKQEPDGTVVLTLIHDRMGGKGRQYQVYVVRPDGDTVVAIESNVLVERDLSEKLARPEPPLTVEQLVQIGRAPGLTLYP